MGKLIRVGVLTVSDRCSSGLQDDASGPAIRSVLPAQEYIVAESALVPDEIEQICIVLSNWCHMKSCDVILTTGGTGFSPRDVTPEATRRILERDAPNISYYLWYAGMQRTPFAALSRGVAGTCGSSLIINLPGSPTGAREGAEALLALLPHTVALMRGDTAHHATDTPTINR